MHLLLVLCTLASISGITAFMVFQWATFDNPIAFAQAQAAWHGNSWGSRLVDALALRPLFNFHIRGLSPQDFDQFAFVTFAALAVVFTRILPGEMSVYSVGALMLPYITLSGGPQGLTSMTRFAVIAFPIFIGIAHLLRHASSLAAAICALLASQLFMWSALFSQ